MPSTGTVPAAKGNLVGYGPSPGDGSGWSGRYDLLDRLVRVTNPQRQRAQYAYHPDELLSVSLNADRPSTDERCSDRGRPKPGRAAARSASRNDSNCDGVAVERR